MTKLYDVADLTLKDLENAANVPESKMYFSLCDIKVLTTLYHLCQFHCVPCDSNVRGWSIL